MNPDIIKTNILSIVAAGLTILLVGIVLYIFKDQLTGKVRFFMPIPPIAVAAYIFVFNMYGYYDGFLPNGNWTAAKEILYSTAVAAIAFGLFTLSIMVLVGFMKKQF